MTASPAVARRVRRARPRPHRRAGVARGARRPRDAGLGVREARGRGRERPAGLPARVGRARRALGPVLVPRPRPGAHHGRARARGRVRPARRRPACRPTDGALAALEALLARVPRAARSPSCRRSTAASSATSATTSCARSSACPTCPPDDLGMPDAVLSVTGHVTAFDHFRQRLYLIENVFLDPTVPTTPRRRRATTPRARGSTARVDELARPLPYVPSPPPASDLDRAAAEYTSTMPAAHVPRGGRSGARAHPRRRHLPGRARAALRPRRPLRPVRRVPGAAPGQPVAVHVLRAPPRGDAGGLVAGADGAAARRPGDQPPDRGHPPPRAHRGRRPAHGRRALGAPEGAGRARDARRPRPQRRRPGRAVRHRADGRADGARALLARDAPHQPGRRRPRRRRATRSTCCGPRSRRAR